MGHELQQARGGTGRSFRAATAWCWQLQPSIIVTGEVYPVLQLDGITVGGMCLLIAITTQMDVVAWQWCDREKQVAWETLMRGLPAPHVVVCDGHKGLLAAIKTSWPDTVVQRCLVHIHRDVVTHLTRHPKTPAGKTLLGLTNELRRVTTIDQAGEWMTRMNHWWNLFGELTRQRTYRINVTDAEVPSWAQPHQQWWYTHARLRRAWRLLTSHITAHTLFVWLDHPGVDPTTNKIEGGINAQIRRILSTHRGLPAPHARRAAEWYCYLHSHHPQPQQLITNPPTTTPHTRHDEPILPPLWGTGLTTEEGLWLRHGWAGRST